MLVLNSPVNLVTWSSFTSGFGGPLKDGVAVGASLAAIPSGRVCHQGGIKSKDGNMRGKFSCTSGQQVFEFDGVLLTFPQITQIG